LYDWRRADTAFQEAWDDALEAGTDLVEFEARRRAIEGVDKPLTYQGQFTYLYTEQRDDQGNIVMDPATGHPVMVVDRDVNGNPKVLTAKEYSDTLLMALLKAYRPERFRDRSDVNVTGMDVVTAAMQSAMDRAKAQTGKK
jgi:hypothetical protein